MPKIIKRIDVRIRPMGEVGIFHDSRGDVRNLALVCNTLIDKVNELTDTINKILEEAHDGN